MSIPEWGKWYRIEDAPPGSYGCLFAKVEGGVFQRPSMAWMPAESRTGPAFEKAVVMPFEYPCHEMFSKQQ